MDLTVLGKAAKVASFQLATASTAQKSGSRHHGRSAGSTKREHSRSER